MRLQNKDKKAQAKELPLSPGVYFFKDINGNILYIGRATSLRKRVLSYFQRQLDPRLREMLDSTELIEFKKTDSVLEAVILEANLIKEYWPKYNVRDRDNRSFAYIVIDRGKYPKPMVVRGRELKKFVKSSYWFSSSHSFGTYVVFGPYKSFYIAKTALHILRHLFPYSTCEPNSGKPCFYFQIGLCPGLCISKISQKEYKKNIDDLILFLKGGKRRLFKRLIKENPDMARSLMHIQDAALISGENLYSELQFHRIEGYDISHLSGRDTYGSMVVFVDSKADKSAYRLFRVREANPSNDLEGLGEVIKRRFCHREWKFPDLIVIDGGKPQVDYISDTLKRLRITIPLLGISKFKDDALVFPAGTKKSFKELAISAKRMFLEVRDEAHRFAQRAHRQKRAKLFIKK